MDTDETIQYLQRLSPKRLKRMMDIVQIERKDAALNGVLVMMLQLNQLKEFGLKRLSRLSESWGKQITREYNENIKPNNNRPYLPYPEGGPPYAGEPRLDLAAEFGDLSESRQRVIRRWVDFERRDAQWNAMAIGRDVLHRDFRVGKATMEKLDRLWQADMANFYEDRDIQEPRLEKLLQDVGFLYSFQNGRFGEYRDKDGKPIRASTAEKHNEIADERARKRAEKKKKSETAASEPKQPLRLPNTEREWALVRGIVFDKPQYGSQPMPELPGIPKNGK